MLSDRCPVCLSVWPVCLWRWCTIAKRTDQDETRRPGRPRPWPHCVRWWPSYPSPKGAQPQFSAHICCGQMAGWSKMPLGKEVGLDPGHIVLDEDPAPLPKKGAQPSPIFGPCLLWPNGWMDQDATWYEDRHRPRPHCVTWGPSSPPQKKGTQPPIFGPCLLLSNGRSSQLLLSPCSVNLLHPYGRKGNIFVM